MPEASKERGLARKHGTEPADHLSGTWNDGPVFGLQVGDRLERTIRHATAYGDKGGDDPDGGDTLRGGIGNPLSVGNGSDLLSGNLGADHSGGGAGRDEPCLKVDRECTDIGRGGDGRCSSTWRRSGRHHPRRAAAPPCLAGHRQPLPAVIAAALSTPEGPPTGRVGRQSRRGCPGIGDFRTPIGD